MERFKSVKSARTPEQLAKNALNMALRKEILDNKWPTSLPVVVDGVGTFEAKPIVSLKSGRILYNVRGDGVGPGGTPMKIMGNLFTDFILPHDTYIGILKQYNLTPENPAMPASAKTEDEALDESETTV